MRFFYSVCHLQAFSVEDELPNAAKDLEKAEQHCHECIYFDFKCTESTAELLVSSQAKIFCFTFNEPKSVYYLNMQVICRNVILFKSFRDHPLKRSSNDKLRKWPIT